MAAPSVVFTVARVAERLGGSIHPLDEIADQLEPEDDCLWIYDTDERATLAFTIRGIERLEELIADQKRYGYSSSNGSPEPAVDRYRLCTLVATT